MNEIVSRRGALGLMGGVTGAATGIIPGLGTAQAGQASGGSGKRKVVVVWSEGTANVDPASKDVYPDDINTAIAEGLKPLQAKRWDVVKASLNDPDQGLSDELLLRTYVLIWWGHKKHRDVKDELVGKIEGRVKEQGMGTGGSPGTWETLSPPQ